MVDKRSFEQFLLNRGGVNVSTVQNWESGRCQPDNAFFQPLTQNLKIHPDIFLKALGNQLDLYHNHPVQTKFRWGHLLPDDFSLGSKEELYFTEEEQQIFNFISLHLQFKATPVSELLNINPDSIQVMKILDKFNRLDLFTSSFSSLTQVGQYVLSCIKESPMTLFNLHGLPFSHFLKFCLICEIYPYLSERIHHLIHLVNEGSIEVRGCIHLSENERQRVYSNGFHPKFSWTETFHTDNKAFLFKNIKIVSVWILNK